jgi:thymidylate kinase
MRTLNYSLSRRQVRPEKANFIDDIVARDNDFAATYDFAKRLRQKILHVSTEFARNNIDVIFIKAFSDFPLDSDNFDILVKGEQRENAISVLMSQGFRELTRCREMTCYGEPFKWLFRRVDSDFPVSVHIHTGIGWEGVEFVAPEHVWERHRLEPIEGLDIGFPSAEHHILITTAHAFFENRSLRLSDLMYMSESLGQPEPIDWDYIGNWCLKDHWLKPFITFLYMVEDVHKSLYGESLLCAQRPKIFDVRPFRNFENVSLAPRFDVQQELPIKIPTIRAIIPFADKVLRTSGSDWKEKARTIWSAGRSYVNRRLPFKRELPARLICFSGQDGTGKTTHAKCLRAELAKKIRLLNDPLVERDFDAKYVWSRATGFNFEPLMQVARMLLLGNRSPRPGKYATKRERLLKREPIRSLWAYAMLIDEILHLEKVRIALLNNQIVICDRYIYDTFVDIECELGKSLSTTAKRVVKGSVPTPALTFLMDADSTYLAERRRHSNLDQIESRRRSYAQYLRADDCFLIDTKNDFEFNRDQITSRALHTLMMA